MQEQLEIEIQKTQTLTIKRILVVFIVICVFIGTFVLTFSQVFFKNDNDNVIEARKEHVLIKKERNNVKKELHQLIYNLQDGIIDTKTFTNKIKKLTPLYKKLETKSTVLFNELIQEKEKQKVFGFKSFKIFIANISMPILAINLSLFLVFFYLKEEDRFLKKITLPISLLGLLSSTFYFAWALYPNKDFSKFTYLTLLLSFSITSSIIAFFLVKYFYILLTFDFKFKIQNLLKFIIYDIKYKYIKKEDQKEYIQDYLEEINKLS